MKFCENCGAQLCDDAVFCEECGTKQEPLNTTEDNVVREDLKETPSNAHVPAKREIKDWLLVALLIVCSPIVMAFIVSFLPVFLFWFVLVVTSFLMIVLLWRKRTWKTWVKMLVTVAYILLYIL